MNTGVNASSRQHCEGGSDAAFRAVILGEDAVAERRARALFTRLERRLWGSMELLLEVWNFQQLTSDETVRQAASVSVGRAEMVIVAMDGLRPLPPLLRLWLDEILVNAAMDSGRGRALVALFKHPVDRAETAAAGRYLSDLAVRTGMDFFLHSSKSKDWSDAFSQAGKWMAWRRDGGGGAFDPNSPSASHWGINE